MRRLQTRAQFQAVLGGMTVSKTAHFALHARALASASEDSGALLFPEPVAWLGAMVPKRWARRAVTRNAIKRQIYSLAAELPVLAEPMAHVVRLRSGFDRSQFPSASSDALKAAVRRELQQLFARARALAVSATP
ncbi:ribonuclease P protein component [uncultured Rhodoferax sp.]|uniref:ribonuclease P protein component n=1 Tax=uncultured Rhodoferax sp. TaxID=223188 RepID=UPI0025FC2A85|nr:ribonuclease P protein component [uncultured Rhodoferax sp.]